MWNKPDSYSPSAHAANGNSIRPLPIPPLPDHTLQTQSRIAALEHALNTFDQAVACLDRNALVLHMSSSMKALVQLGDDVVLSHGRLELKNHTQNEELKAAMKLAVSGDVSGRAGRALLIPREGTVSLQVTLVPHTSSSVRGAISASVFIGDPTRIGSSKAKLLRDLYKLSPVEARVAELLTQGLTINETASYLKLTADTVRFHTKRIFAKTGSHRQVELIKTVLSLPNLDLGAVSTSPATTAPLPTNPVTTAVQVEERRGRLLELPATEWMRRRS